MSLPHRNPHVFTTVATTLLLSSGSALAGARVIITEIMYNPNSFERSGETEWVEIANVGDEPITIKDWRLDDEDDDDWGTFSCTLEPGKAVVLINADAVSEEAFRKAWGNMPPRMAAEANEKAADANDADESGAVDDEGDQRDVDNAESSSKENGGDDAQESDAAASDEGVNPTGELALDPQPPVGTAAIHSYQILPVQWGSLANTANAGNETLRLLDELDEMVCEVAYESGGDWPALKPDGPSIWLTDVTVENLNDGKLWLRSEEDKNGARTNQLTNVFDGIDIGSPGWIPWPKEEADAKAAEEAAEDAQDAADDDEQQDDEHAVENDHASSPEPAVAPDNETDEEQFFGSFLDIPF